MTLKLAVEQLYIGQLTMGRWKLLNNFSKREQVGQYTVSSKSLMMKLVCTDILLLT